MPEVATKLKTYRFDQMAVQVKDKVHPDDADVDRYVGLEHIDPESLKIRRWGEPSDVESTKILFRAGDIIFGKRRAYQRKLAVADFDGICSAHAMVLRPKTDVVLKEFLPFFMQTDTFMERAVKISVGGLSPTINWKDLAKEEFALPPIEEQRRMVAVLSASVESCHKAMALATQLNHLIDASFEGALGLSMPSLQSRDSKWYGRVPDSWRESLLLDASLVITDGEHNTPPRTESGVPLLSARNVLHRRIDLSDVDYISAATHARLSERIQPVLGDVLISCSGTVGRVCEVPSDFDFAMVRSVAVVRPDATILDHRFLAEVLRSRYGQRQISTLTNQTAQGNLFQGEIGRIVVPLLPLDRQREIADRCEEIFRQYDEQERRVTKAQRLHADMVNTIAGGDE